MLEQLDRMQASTLVSLLSALLEHPEFQRGVHVSHEFFFDSYEEASLTEAEMLDEVEWNLSRRITAAEQRLRQAIGVEPSSYLHRLGWVVGTIAKGLTYAR